MQMYKFFLIQKNNNIKINYYTAEYQYTKC